ncbi:efflux RND transporter periplasmic adaptor subunit, partial [Streptomyces turgidiscabies]
SGKRQVVLIEEGEGRYRPQAVILGRKGDRYTEIVDGVTQGDRVVVTANFLIDSESNLRAALTSFTKAPEAAK